MMLWQPVIDGYVIPARPIDRIAAGAGSVLVGFHTSEHEGMPKAHGLARYTLRHDRYRPTSLLQLTAAASRSAAPADTQAGGPRQLRVN
jgi:hypothetical protein